MSATDPCATAAFGSCSECGHTFARCTPRLCPSCGHAVMTQAEYDEQERVPLPTTTAATVCGESPTGIPGCHAPIGYYVEWTEGGIMQLAATLCDLHTADLRAGHSPYPDADEWPVEVTRVRDIDSHDALCRASRKALFDKIDAEREAGNV